MNVDFFKSECCDSTSEIRFGICDEENKEPAYIDTDYEENWIAIVLNGEAKKIQFTAIDNCIDVFRKNGDMEKRCDAMLSYDSTLIFVELKTKRRDWKTEGLNQIEATLQRMIIEDKEYYFGFKKRKAIVANLKNAFPAFQSFDSERRAWFNKEYGIRLQFEAQIVIK